LYREALDEVVLAEELGFDSVWMEEHHGIKDHYWPSPLLVLGGFAVRTSRIRLGTDVVVLPFHHPTKVAEDAAMVDVISGGRLLLTLGASYVSEDLDAFGVDPSKRGALMEDTVRFLQEAWTNDNLDFDGEVFHFKNMRITPKPIQKPRPEIALGAWTPQGLRRAGRLGDRWTTDIINTIQTYKGMAEIYRASAEKNGKTPKITIMRECWVAPTTEQAIEEFHDDVMTSHRFYYGVGAYSPLADPWITDLKSDDEFTYDKVSPDRFIVGSPEHIINEVERFQSELPELDYIVTRFRHPSGPSHEKALESIKMFGEKVIPHFS
ncbi:MAG: LLM class flavin-dependent oxidoreductase, partial [Actinomycetota bacterium]|nr:LLM class flavin-dependent oxidoreductase [Actinomycetota bacterium]